MSEQIEPGDLVRVIRSHCPAAWAEEQGTYFVVTAVGILHRGLVCGTCGADFAVNEVCADMPGVDEDGDEGAFPCAWLRKVPGLTANEVAEFLSDVLDEIPEPVA